MNNHQAFVIADWLIQLRFKVDKINFRKNTQLYIKTRSKLIEELQK